MWAEAIKATNVFTMFQTMKHKWSKSNEETIGLLGESFWKPVIKLGKNNKVLPLYLLRHEKAIMQKDT